MKLKPAYALALILTLSGCASAAPESDPAYVSPTQYQDFNCKQLGAEMRRVNTKIEQASATEGTQQVMNTALAAFAISQGAAYDTGDDTQIRRLRNQYDVLEETSIRKKCNLR